MCCGIAPAVVVPCWVLWSTAHSGSTVWSTLVVQQYGMEYRALFSCSRLTFSRSHSFSTCSRTACNIKARNMQHKSMQPKPRTIKITDARATVAGSQPNSIGGPIPTSAGVTGLVQFRLQGIWAYMACRVTYLDALRPLGLEFDLQPAHRRELGKRRGQSRCTHTESKAFSVAKSSHSHR